MKRLFFLSFVLLFTACSGDENTGKKPVVIYYGALQNIMHSGDLSAQFDLKEIEGTEHLYALGVMENLVGEIQIFDGNSYTTQVIDSNVQFDRTYNIKAALFAYSVVEEWNTIDIPDSVVSYDQLDNFIAHSAKENSLDPSKPFAFRITGTPASFNWHIINWPKGDTEHTHNKHVESGLHGMFKERSVELIGFYSTSHHKILTHHTTNMHIHFRTIDGQLAGHLDGITLDEGMKLMLPK